MPGALKPDPFQSAVIDYVLDPLVHDADGDADGDRATNIKEYFEGTDPLDPESHPPRALPWLILLMGEN